MRGPGRLLPDFYRASMTRAYATSKSLCATMKRAPGRVTAGGSRMAVPC